MRHEHDATATRRQASASPRPKPRSQFSLARNHVFAMGSILKVTFFSCTSKCGPAPLTRRMRPGSLGGSNAQPAGTARTSPLAVVTVLGRGPGRNVVEAAMQSAIGSLVDLAAARPHPRPPPCPSVYCPTCPLLVGTLRFPSSSSLSLRARKACETSTARARSASS